MSETTIDLENIDWEKDSWVVAEIYPQHFDPDKYNWQKDSRYVAECCPQYFDP